VDLSNYTAAQQLVVNTLINKIYGAAPPAVVAAHFTGAPVTSAEFNSRITQLIGLMAYLEDARRDEAARANVAEQTLNNRINMISGLLAGGETVVIEEYIGTFVGTSLTLTAGRSLIGGVLHVYSTISMPVVFPSGFQRKLVAHTDGSASVELTNYTDTPTTLTIGYWDGSMLTPTASLTVFNQAVQFDNDVTLGGDDQSVIFQVGVEILTDNRTIETTYNPTNGRIASIAEKDGATTVKSTTFSYDAQGNISNTITTAGGKTVVAAYTYNGDGNPTVEEHTVS
jgi:YD repeat-containing protein